MWVVDISSDMIRLFVEGKLETFARNGVETTFGPRLVSIYRQHPTDQILVINGPGWFTNLRVGALALSLLNALVWVKIEFFSCNKIDMYAALVRHGILPGQGALYLGQKHNVWRYDFTQMSSTQLRLESLPVKENVPYFVDFVSDAQYWGDHVPYMVDIAVSDAGLLIVFCGRNYTLLFAEIMKNSSPVVVPQYFVEAI